MTRVEYSSRVAMRDHPRLYAVDLSRCDALDLFDAPALAEAFASAMAGAGATIVHRAMHLFPESGLTCVLILAESHAVIHTWPETGTVNLDIFSCSPRLKSLAAIHELARLLGAQDISVQEIARADGHRRAAIRIGR
jgi:S-adenosylmethionine decarboxylase proenzyme